MDGQRQEKYETGRLKGEFDGGYWPPTQQPSWIREIK